METTELPKKDLPSQPTEKYGSEEFEFERLKEQIKNLTGLDSIEGLAMKVLEKFDSGEFRLADITKVQQVLQNYRLNTGHLPRSKTVENEWNQLYCYFKGRNDESKNKTAY